MIVRGFRRAIRGCPRQAPLLAALVSATLLASVTTGFAAPNAAPVLVPPPDIYLFEGRTATQALGASDADGDLVTFYKASGPDYLTVTSREPGYNLGDATVTPAAGDAGDTTATIGATDGVLTDEEPLRIHVFDASPEATRFQLGSGACSAAPPPVQNYLITMPTGNLFASGEPLRVEVNISGDGHTWRVDFEPAAGHLLETGYRFYGDPGFEPETPGGHPHLMVLRDGSGWSGTTNAYEIRRLVFGPSNQVISLWATFEQECAGGLNLRGEIRYNVPVDVAVTAPLYEVVERSHALSFGVAATDADAGPVTLTAPLLPAGSQFSDHGDGTGTFSWVPSSAQRGVHTATFEGADQTDHRSGASITIRVRGTTSGRFTMFADDGSPEVLTPDDARFDVDVVTGLGGSASTTISRDGLALWRIDMISPAGVDFAVGSYEDAQDYTGFDPLRPKLVVVRRSSIYPFDLGRFEIKQIERDAAQGILRLWATFELGNGTSEPFRGEIRYDADPVSARVFVAERNGEVDLLGAAPFWRLRLEPVGGSFALEDLNLSALTLQRRDGEGVLRELRPVVAQSAIQPDQDGNGVPELELVFPLEEVRSFFHDVSGRATARLELAASLDSGEPLSESVTLTVNGAGGSLAIAAAPNPLNPGTSISFHTPSAGHVALRIFDVHGRLVRTLENGVRPSGYHTVRWDGETDRGGLVASGVYQVLVETPSGRRSRALTVIR